MKCNPVRLALFSIALLAAVNANASLTSQGSPGAQTVLDSTAGLVWADTASPSTGVFWDASGSTGSAQAWIASLNSANYGGINTWALPTLTQLESIYTDLGNTLGRPANTTSGTTQANLVTTPFTTLSATLASDTLGTVWAGSLSSVNNNTEDLHFFGGNQGSTASIGSTGYFYAAMAVAAVPEPETFALMLARLGLLGFNYRRKKSV
jgi:hypothetical protein